MNREQVSRVDAEESKVELSALGAPRDASTDGTTTQGQKGVAGPYICDLLLVRVRWCLPHPGELVMCRVPVTKTGHHPRRPDCAYASGGI
jgi:hypothetical protein